MFSILGLLDYMDLVRYWWSYDLLVVTIRPHLKSIAI